MLRFTIRDVMWLTALVALGAGWRSERSQKIAMSNALADVRKENAHMRQFIESRYEYVELNKWGWNYKERQQASHDNRP
jgi:hypothetical protein